MKIPTFGIIALVVGLLAVGIVVGMQVEKAKANKTNGKNGETPAKKEDEPK